MKGPRSRLLNELYYVNDQQQYYNAFYLECYTQCCTKVGWMAGDRQRAFTTKMHLNNNTFLGWIPLFIALENPFDSDREMILY